jgi:muramoyltetrapeptide carboxypeptidase
MVTPPYLQKGNTIGIVCPAGYMPISKAAAAISAIEAWGYNVKIGKTLGSGNNYFSGTDEERLSDLQEMLNDDAVHAILCGRGGYGVSKIMDALNWEKFKQTPKWIIGFSDITALHAHINSQLGIATLHAPMAGAFNENGATNQYVQSLKNALEGICQSYEANPFHLNRIGETKGELVGGNLSLIAHLCGTKSAYKTERKILFLEDVGEYLYNIDRMMLQLNRSGMLASLSGIIFGGFTELKDTDRPFGATIESILYSKVAAYNYPVCFQFPVSHTTENYALKIGKQYRLAVNTHSVQLKEL